MKRTLAIVDPKEKELIAELGNKKDTVSARIARLLDLPDLTKKDGSPVKILFDQIINLPRFQDFDFVSFPKIVSIEDNFDLLNTPKDHPSRRVTDTYYVDPAHVLRTQMTVMWPFYLRDKDVLAALEKDGEIKALAAGIVFRKDEIDRNHFPAFHQIDGLYISKKTKKIITVDDLKEVQIDMAKSIFGSDLEYQFLEDTFPFTDPSVEMDIKFNGEWLEVNGAGLVHPQVLRNFGLDPELYNGWAFGFGDRLAMIKMGIPDIRILWSEDPRITSQFKDINSTFTPVSKFPPITRDISFIVSKTFIPNDYFNLIRDIGGDLVEEVKLLDTYADAKKFGEHNVSYTYRTVYRSLERTLTNEEVNALHEQIQNRTISEFGAVIR